MDRVKIGDFLEFFDEHPELAKLDRWGLVDVFESLASNTASKRVWEQPELHPWGSLDDWHEMPLPGEGLLYPLFAAGRIRSACFFSIYNELEITIKRWTTIIDSDPRKTHQLNVKDFHKLPSLQACVKYLDGAYNLELEGSHHWRDVDKLRLIRNYLTHSGDQFDGEDKGALKAIKEIAVNKKYAALVTEKDEMSFEFNPEAVLKATKSRPDVPSEPFTVVFLEGFLEYSLHCSNKFLAYFFEKLRRWDSKLREA